MKDTNFYMQLFSIVQTAKVNWLRVEQYLKYVIEMIEKLSIENLLPWSDKLPNELKIKIVILKL